MPDSFERPAQRSRFFGPEGYGQESYGHDGSGFSAEPERASMSDWAGALTWSGDETRLVTELQAGSETAFDWLVTHYHGPVYNLILSMLGDVADAADGTQEVFLKAFRGIRSFRHGSSLKTWLYRIAIREALNHKRWFKRHLQKNVSIDAEPEEGHAAIEIEDLAQTPFDQFAAHEIQAAVQSALQQIPDVFRSAVILRDLEGLAYEEVAEVLECSVGTVKSRILRGRRALKDLLEPLLSERPANLSIAQRTERTNVIEMRSQKPAYGANAATSSPFATGLHRRAADLTAGYNFLRKNSTREELP